MIFALKTKHTEVLDKFIDRFSNPKNLSMAMLHNAVYVENKVEWVGDLLVFRQKSVMDNFSKFGIVASVGMILLSLFLQSTFLLQLGFILTLICMATISPMIRFLSISLKLFIMGHRSRIKLVSNTLLLEQLFYERESKGV